MKKLIAGWALPRLSGMALLAAIAAGCGKSQDGVAGGPPKGDAIPAFYGIYAWDGTASALPGKGQILWRSQGGEKLGGIIVFHQVLTSGMAPPEKMIHLRKAVWLRNEIEYVSLESDQPQLLRVMVRPCQQFKPSEEVALKFMPLEKPGAVLAVPASTLAPGIYALEFMDETHAFSVGVGSAAEGQNLPDATQDRVVLSRANGPGMSWEQWLNMSPGQRQQNMFNEGRSLKMREFTRDASFSDQEATHSKTLAKDAWEKKDYFNAFHQAVLALGYQPGDTATQKIAFDGPLIAAKAEREARNWPAAERWATHSYNAGLKRDEAAALLEDMMLHRLSEEVSKQIDARQWKQAYNVLNNVPYALRNRPQLKALEEKVKKQELLARAEGMISSGQYDEAAELITNEGQRSGMTSSEVEALFGKMRQTAHKDAGYYGSLFKPVWQIQIGDEELHVQVLLKVPGRDKLIATMGSYGQGKVHYVALKASTGEVLWRVTQDAPPAAMSEDGRYLVLQGKIAGARFDDPEMAFVMDLESKRLIDSLTTEWPGTSNHQVPFAVSGAAGLYARSLPGHEFVVEIFKLSTGALVRRIAPPGLRRSRASDWNRDQPSVPVLAFTPKGDKLVTVDEDEVVRVFDPSTGVQVGEGVKVDEADQGTILVNDNATKILASRSGILGGICFIQELKPSVEKQSIGGIMAISPDWKVAIESAGMSFGSPSMHFTSTVSAHDSHRMEMPFNPTAAAFDDAEHVVYAGGRKGTLARFAVLADTPSNTALATSTPTAKSPQPAPAGSNGSSPQAGSLPDRLAAFILAHHKNEESRNTDAVLLSYAPLVDYFESGNVGHDHIRKDKDAYFRKWTTIRNTVKHQPRAEQLESGAYRLAYPMNFEVQSPTGERIEGDVECEVEVAVTADGKLQIVREKGRVTRREKR